MLLIYLLTYIVFALLSFRFATLAGDWQQHKTNRQPTVPT